MDCPSLSQLQNLHMDCPSLSQLQTLHMDCPSLSQLQSLHMDCLSFLGGKILLDKGQKNISETG
jgi:hypothetical protein